MEGGQELERLADLLRLSAEVARSIGQTRRADLPEFDDIGDDICDVARRIDMLAASARVLS